MLQSFCNLFFLEIQYFEEVINNKRRQGGYDDIRTPVSLIRQCGCLYIVRVS